MIRQVSPMKTFPRSNRAFTLIELLTVIAIIALLAGLLFPAIKSAMLKAEVTKAQVQISNLQTAIKSYYTEYGRWPVMDNTVGTVNSNYTYTVDTNFVALLQGANNTATITGGGGFPPPAFTPVSTSSLQGNPRQIHFMEFKSSELDPVLGYLDPWKQPYFCRFDVSYVNNLSDPFASGTTPLTAKISPDRKVQTGFVVWSAGPDGRYDNQDDAATGPSALNKDNVKSW
jgi:prepilin-type N-terminal cleavage/methylation domain-containing protein